MARKTWKWQPETRAAIIANDNGRCVACGCADVAVLEMDHIIPAGPTTVDNGQAMCGPCNRAKADVSGLVEMEPFETVDLTATVGEYFAATDSMRETFADHMADVRRHQDAVLLNWARGQIGGGRRVASVIRSIAAKHNTRVAKRVSRAL